MESWLEITIAIVGLLGTVFGVLGISGYLGERAKHKAEKQNKKEDQQEKQLQEAADQRLRDGIRGVFKEENKPINDKLDNITADVIAIKEDLANNTKGTVTLLRNDMKKSLDYCKRQGYAGASDRANWHELYNTYGKLGGNHFKEYVDAWKEELEKLPASAPIKGRKSKAVKADSEDK